MCPRLDHIITKKQYFPNLAKKVLDNSASTGKLPDRISDLGCAKDSAIDFFTSLATRLKLSEADAVLDCSEADAALEAAERSVTLVAAMNIVQNYPACAQGRAMATSLLRKATCVIPDSLKKLLEKQAAA